MLNPEYLTHCTDEVESLFAELEENILVDIARRISENDYQNTSTAQHQLNRMKAMGVQYDEMQKMLSEKLDITEKKVSEIISKSSYGSVDKDNVIFKEAYKKGIIHHFNYNKDGLKEIILQGIVSTNGEIKNICKTSAATAQNLFVNYLDQVYLSVSSGAFSQQEAVKAAVNDLSKQGIHWIDYKSGAHRRLDTAVRTALRSGVNQTACRCQDKNFDDMGGNLVEVTSHMGARPTHAEWQGKIYWRKEKYKNYRNFEEATGYGKGDGLGGWNCRHSFYPYFEGLSSKSFEHYRLTENNERYELDQQQRYNERKIREWKRRQAVNKAGGVDVTLEARKVKEWQKRQSDFLKKHPDMKHNYAMEVSYANAQKTVQSIAHSLIKIAKSKEKVITSDLLKAVKKGTGKLEGLNYRVKGLDSLERKLKSKSLSKGISVNEYAKQVTDVLRYTNVSPAKNLVEDYFTIVESLNKKGYNMIEVTNTLDNKSYYRGINTLVKNKDGFVFELQFHTPESLHIKEINHKLYEEQRLDKTSIQRKKELNEIMKKNADSIESPINIHLIKNIER